MKRFLLALACLAVLPLTACAVQRQPAKQAYTVDSYGNVSTTTRSALAGSTAPGAQEIIGVYIPFVGTGLAVKAGLEWDGTPTVIEVPMAAPAPQSACAPQVVEEQVTEYVPETRMVPRTRTIKRALVPVPQAAPPCQPAPQVAPRPGCEPVAVCPAGGPCEVPTETASK